VPFKFRSSSIRNVLLAFQLLREQDIHLCKIWIVEFLNAILAWAHPSNSMSTMQMFILYCDTLCGSENHTGINFEIQAHYWLIWLNSSSCSGDFNQRFVTTKYIDSSLTAVVWLPDWLWNIKDRGRRPKPRSKVLDNSRFLHSQDLKLLYPVHKYQNQILDVQPDLDFCFVWVNIPWSKFKDML
jgi:hypothetical protein